MVARGKRFDPTPAVQPEELNEIVRLRLRTFTDEENADLLGSQLRLSIRATFRFLLALLKELTWHGITSLCVVSAPRDTALEDKSSGGGLICEA